ncbi:hypothetical protein B0T26DRAFT_732034 [Lasiosphaeria miniovina]|uniref:Uncharacterized protein n=1 Tax=Lasiosphaeria miniovina TaxID=1954250 RepID=A0AA39ZU56_9PEZI|nr:uncharacterized protein B0T26DRAFT_732034 [Lasiosphaeria miniovina]KAK0703605.1 hypothetical protein B0T26DRAFT_732034 [Lasiosphaeria miniovina]
MHRIASHHVRVSLSQTTTKKPRRDKTGHRAENTVQRPASQPASQPVRPSIYVFLSISLPPFEMMDLPVQMALGLIKGVLPSSAVQFIQENLLDPASPAQAVKREASGALWAIGASVWPVVAPLVDRATAALSRSPDMVVAAAFLVVVLVVYQVLSLVRRVMMFWTRLAVRAVMWAGVAALLAMAWQRGIEASVRDAVVILSKVAGFGGGVANYFVQEYQRYDAQQREVQQHQQQQQQQQQYRSDDYGQRSSRSSRGQGGGWS